MADFLKFTVPGKAEYVGVVRLAVSSAANTAGFNLEDIEDIQVAVSEVCNHIFCDCRSGESVNYDVYCEVGDNCITISIDDGIDPGIEPEDMREDVECYTSRASCCEEVKRCAEETMNGREKFPCRDLSGGENKETETTQIFDPYTSLLMLRALMDEVQVYSDRRNRDNMLIRLIKYL